MLDRSPTPEVHGVGPCLAELFRTTVYPPAMRLRIEKAQVEVRNLDEGDGQNENGMWPADRTKQVYRLFLTDGVLVVQALLESRPFLLVDFDDAVAGNIIVLKKFRIRRAKRLNGPGEVVFLGIVDCEFVCLRRHAQQTQTQTQMRKRHAVECLNGEKPERDVAKKKLKWSSSASRCSPEMSKTHRNQAEHLRPSQDSDSDDFESMIFDHDSLDRKRTALHELSTNRSFESQKSSIPKDMSITELHTNAHPAAVFEPTRTEPSAAAATTPLLPPPPPTTPLLPPPPPTTPLLPPPPPTRTTTGSEPRTSPASPATISSHPNQEQARPATAPSPSSVSAIAITSSHAPEAAKPHRHGTAQHHPPYHTLISLLSPDLPKRSYACTIFATISWVSPSVLPPRHPHSPFPSKRHIKIHDPTISTRHSGITVAVYCDAANFRPRVGTLALFTGLVMQRTLGGEVILNAYERLMRHESTKWFEDDERVMAEMGWAVDGMRRWWVERERAKRPRGLPG